MPPAIPPSPAAEQARLRLFGSVDLQAPVGGDPDALLRQPKRLALVVFLLLYREGAFCSRDRLVSIFWPDSDARRARGALRQGLYYIRSALGEGVLECRGDHALRVRPGVLWCDALHFSALLGREREVEAMELYRGALLESFHVQGSQPFDEWLGRIRASYRRDAARAAWRLAERAEGRGDGPDAAFWGKRALSLSPFDETHVRHLLELLDRVGDRTGALRAYRGLRRHLMEEFDAVPSPETERLVEGIRARHAPVAGSVPSTVSGRRVGVDRRWGKPRRDQEGEVVVERRSGRDRRRGERRSHQDWRTL